MDATTRTRETAEQWSQDKKDYMRRIDDPAERARRQTKRQETQKLGRRLRAPVVIDWMKLNTKIPIGRDDPLKAFRKKLFDRIDEKRKGRLSLSDTVRGMRNAVGLEECVLQGDADALFKYVIPLAFDKASAVSSLPNQNPSSSSLSPLPASYSSDTLERIEFRLLLVYIRHYLEFFCVFDEADVASTGTLNLQEFRAALPIIEKKAKSGALSVPVKGQEDPARLFETIDTKRRGEISFDDFIHYFSENIDKLGLSDNSPERSRNEIHVLEQTITNLKTENESVRFRSKEVKDDVSRLTRANDGLRSELADAKQEISVLRRQVDDLKGLNQMRSVTAEQFAVVKATSEKRQRDLQLELEAALREVGDLTDTNGKLRRQLTETREALNASTHRSSADNMLVDDLKREQLALEERLRTVHRDYEERVTLLEKDMAKAVHERSVLDEQIEPLRIYKRQTTATLSSLQQERAEIMQQVVTLRSDYDEQIRLLEADLHAAAREKTVLTEAHAKEGSLLAMQNERLRGNVSTLEETVRQLREEQEQRLLLLQKESERSIHSQLSPVQAENQRMRDENSRLHEKVMNLEKDLRTKDSELNHVQQNLQIVERSAQEDREKHEDRSVRYQQQLKRLEEELDQSRLDLNASRQQLSQMRENMPQKDENIRLKREIEVLEEQLNSGRIDYERRIKELEDHLLRASDDRRRLEKRVAELETDVSVNREHATALDPLQRENQRLREERLVFDEEIRQLRLQTSSRQVALESELSTVKEERRQLEHQNSTLRQEVKGLELKLMTHVQREVALTNSDLEKARSELEQHRMNEARLEERLVKAQQELRDHENQVTELRQIHRNEREAFMDRIDRLERQLQKQQTDLDGSRLLKDTVESQRHQLESTILTLQKELQANEQRQRQAHYEQQRSMDLRELEDENEGLQNDLREVQRQLREAEADVGDLKKDLRQADAEGDRLRDELEACRRENIGARGLEREIDELKRDLSDAEREIVDIKRDLTNSDRENQRLRGELQPYEDDIRALRRQLADAEREADDLRRLRGDTDQLQRVIDLERSRNNELESRVREHVAELRAEKDASAEDIGVLERQNHQLRQDIEHLRSLNEIALSKDQTIHDLREEVTYLRQAKSLQPTSVRRAPTPLRAEMVLKRDADYSAAHPFIGFGLVERGSSRPGTRQSSPARSNGRYSSPATPRTTTFTISVPVMTLDEHYAGAGGDIFFDLRAHRKLTEDSTAINAPPMRVGTVFEDGPAWRKGLRLGDEVLEINGHPIRSLDDVQMILKQEAVVGRHISLLVRRRHESMYLQNGNGFGHQSSIERDISSAAPFVGFGLVEEVTKIEEPDGTHSVDTVQLIIDLLYRDSPAWAAGLRVGDYVTGFGRYDKLTSVAQVRSVLAQDAIVGKSIRVTAQRPTTSPHHQINGGRPFTVDLDVKTTDSTFRGHPSKVFYHPDEHEKFSMVKN